MQRIMEKNLQEIGVTINGNKPYDIQIHDTKFFSRVLRDQTIGAGEAYMEGMWDCERLDELFFRVCYYNIDSRFYSPLKIFLTNVKNTLFNQQSREKAAEVAKCHYDLGPSLYEAMLGKSLAYTCGYWKTADNLDDAQFAKYELVCKKLMLKPGEKVLEIGCGMGGLAKYMAENYNCEVVAIDISHQQATYAKQHCRNLPVTVYETDYRDVDIYNPNKEKFDKIVSVGVLEHIGFKNYDLLLNIAREFIKEDGIFLLHSIGSNVSMRSCNPWIDKYIFPNGMLPSLKQLGPAFEKRFIVEDLQNFGFYYDPTLLAWHKNFNDHWPELKGNYNNDEKFRRMMNYYLLSCAGAFRARGMQLWQFILTPKGILRTDKDSRIHTFKDLY